MTWSDMLRADTNWSAVNRERGSRLIKLIEKYKSKKERDRIDAEYSCLPRLYEDGLKFGVAVSAVSESGGCKEEIGDPAKEALIKRCFNSLTPENEMKPAYCFDPVVEPLFRCNRSLKRILDFAKNNRFTVRGHCLVWYKQTDPRIFCKNYEAYSDGSPTTSHSAVLDEECLVSRDELIKRMRRYIRGVFEFVYRYGYADTVYAYDVVNEANDADLPNRKYVDYWHHIIGPEYVYLAFLFAREAIADYSKEYADIYGIDQEDTEALKRIRPLLFYNEHFEWEDHFHDRVLKLLTETSFNPGQQLYRSNVISENGNGTLLADGLVDGIGLQGHIRTSTDLHKYEKCLYEYGEKIGLIHVTELDINRKEKPGADCSDIYRDYIRMIRSVRENGVPITSVTMWGLTDNRSWLGNNGSLLFDEYSKPKKEFYAVYDGQQKI